MLGNCAAKSSPHWRPGKACNFFAFLLARSAIEILIRAKSHDFSQNNNTTTNNRRSPTLWPKHYRNLNSSPLIAEKAQLSKKQAGEILDHIAALAYKHAKDTFTLPGIGKLVLKDRAARMGRNPKTGEAIQIKAKRVVKFRVAKAAKDAILGTK